MSTKLVAYEYVPSGFEMIIKNSGKAEQEIKAWNLWFNLTHDPEAWDNEIKRINEMQERLGEPTVDQRLIRAQMAEFCRLHPPFPQSIDILCEEIGTGRFSKPVKMGCEGRGLLDSLGYHGHQSLKDQLKEILTKYARSLKKWLEEGRPENPAEFKVFGFLGQPVNNKESFVRKLISMIDSEVPPISSLKKLSENECKKADREFETLGFRPFNCFLPACWPDGFPDSSDSIPGRKICCYFMFIDAGLLCAGTFGEKRSMFDEFRQYTEENILAYSLAINTWLKEAPPKPVTSLINPRYIAEDNALEIAETVHSALGEKDEAKEWLTACLLKTIKNQLHSKRTELIDDFPEAISWLKDIL